MAVDLKWHSHAIYTEEYIKSKAYNNGFTIKQACMSSTAKIYNYANKPTDEELERLKETLRVVNDIVGKFEEANPEYGIWIESGYRSQCLNNKVATSGENSGHRQGGAVDLKLYRRIDYKVSNVISKENPIEKLFEIAAKYILDNKIQYDEYLRETYNGGYWFHLALTGRDNRKRKKTMTIPRGSNASRNKPEWFYGLTIKYS
jgi:hypothetical protein